MKLGLISLGCDKNTVDSERILAAISGHGAHHVRDLTEAEVIVVNTCGFIDAAKEESIGVLLDVSRLKHEGNCRAVVALGCLVEQYCEELESSLPEIDLFIGLTCEAIIERPEDGRIVGRTRAQADDVDGITYLGPASDMLPAGTLVEVEITGAGDFDLEGKILREVRSVAAADGLTEPGHVGRALPVAMIGLDGGWGR